VEVRHRFWLKKEEKPIMKRLRKRLTLAALAVALLMPGMPGAAAAGSSPVFPDVNANTVTAKVQKAIETFSAEGIIRGYPDGTFGPNKPITRAQFAKILAQVQGLEPNPEAASQFTDITDPEQRGWVGALVAAGLTTGTMPATYSPNQPIQRDQFATFLTRALGAEEIAERLGKTPGTKDGARISAAHRANVALLMELGLVSGYPDGNYGPAQPVKRQQAASVLYDLRQNREHYRQAARQLANHLQVKQAEDGTLILEGFINGASEVDVTLTEAGSERLLFAEEGLETSGDGAFSVRTSQLFLTPMQVRAVATGYDKDGEKLTEVAVTARVGQIQVKGLLDGPDLLQVEVDPKDGQKVRYTFDEPIRRIEEPERFFLITAAGTRVRAEKTEIDSQNDKVVIARLPHEHLVATATIAGVQAAAVLDKEQRENVPYSLPLQDVILDGGTVGPQLREVTLSAFTFDKGDRPAGETIRAEFSFDKTLDKDTRLIDEDASHFGLVLKDGTVLRGSKIRTVRTSSIVVDFELNVSLPVKEPKDRPDYIFSKRYFDLQFAQGTQAIEKVTFTRDLTRDEVVRAFVDPGVLRSRETVYTDKPATNPLSVIDMPYGRLMANELRSAELDAEDGRIELQFQNSLESLVGDGQPYPSGERGFEIMRDDLSYGITINLITGESVPLRQIEVRNTRGERSGDGFTLEIKKRDALIRFDEEAVATVGPDGREMSISQILALAASVAVHLNPWTAAPDPAGWQPYPENGVIGTSVAPLSREVEAGKSAAPVLQEVSGRYSSSEGALIVHYRFSHRVTDVDESRFLLYTADGDWFDADQLAEVDRQTVSLLYRISREEADAIVLAVTEEGAAKGDSFLSGLESPPASLPYKK
jgi:hypothetical protein